MRYSVDINETVESLTHCLNKVNNEVQNIDEWFVNINAGGIKYGIYFNFDIENKELEISNQPSYDDSLFLDEIIDKINEYYRDDEE